VIVVLTKAVFTFVLALAATCLFYTDAGAGGKKVRTLATTIDYTFEVLELPGGVGAVDFNDKDEFAGWLMAAPDRRAGALIDRKDAVSTFQCGSQTTIVRAMNNKGTITGDCEDGTAFLRQRDGRLVNFQLPCPTGVDCRRHGMPQMSPWNINDQGDVVGHYFNPPRFHGQRPYTFLYKGGKFLDPLDAPPLPDHVGGDVTINHTAMIGINNRGQKIGYNQTIFLATNQVGQTLWWIEDNGQYTPLPGVVYAEKINNDAQIIVKVQGEENGYSLWDDGRLYKLTLPAGWLWTELWSINDRGQLLGTIHENKENPVHYQVIATPVTPSAAARAR
jgi:hypothetical protein